MNRKGTPSNLMKPIQKGEVRNPKGREPMPKELKGETANARARIAKIIEEIAEMNIADLAKLTRVVQSEMKEGVKEGVVGVKAIKAAIAVGLIKDMSKGQLNTIIYLSDRILGRPKETVDLTLNEKIDIGIIEVRASLEELDIE